jgi:hypothetical protein
MKKFLQQTRVLQKTCPHCGEVNHLALIDLIRSFYLHGEAYTSVARHWCHHCHKGWDVDWFFTLQFSFYIFCIVVCASRADKVVHFLSPYPGEPWISYGITMSAFLAGLVFIDFYIKVLLVRFLPVVKQT